MYSGKQFSIIDSIITISTEVDYLKENLNSTDDRERLQQLLDCKIALSNELYARSSFETESRYYAQ